jgi:hypothetical protein
MITLIEGTCQQIANIEKMLIITGGIDDYRTGNQEPLFPEQKDFKPMVFYREYDVYIKDKWMIPKLVRELVPVRFSYNILEDKATIKTNRDGTGLLNRLVPEEKRVPVPGNGKAVLTKENDESVPEVT